MSSILLPRRIGKPPLGAQVDWSHPLSWNLRGLWLLNEGAGGLLSDLTGALNATCVSAPAWLAATQGAAVNLNGTASAAPGPTLSGAFTVAIGYQALPGNSFPQNGLFGTRSPSDDSFDMQVDQTTFHGDIGNGVSWLNTSLNFNYTSGSAPHVVVNTVDALNVWRAYVDGVLQATIALSGTPLILDPTHVLTLGGVGANGTALTGMLFYAALWNRALSAAEIASLYADPYQMVAAPSSYRYLGAGGSPTEPYPLGYRVLGDLQANPVYRM